jgi:hypothetical protein
MPSAGLEPAIPATKRPQTYALDRADTGMGVSEHFAYKCQQVSVDVQEKAKIMPYLSSEGKVRTKHWIELTVLYSSRNSFGRRTDLLCVMFSSVS